MSYFQRVIYFELEDIVGASNVTNKRADLDAVSTDVCSISRFWIDRGEEPVKPDIMVFPETTEQVSKVLKLANTYRIPVTPRGGGAGSFFCAGSSVRYLNLPRLARNVVSGASSANITVCGLVAS